jgi:SAM-dependent methyltransferase
MGSMTMDPAATDPPYLAPYLCAARAHGAGFGSLLWASPSTQAARFEAIARIHPLEGKSLLDVGCGRADLLDFLRARGVRPADYIGIEAVDELADAAARKQAPGVRIISADFVREPARMFVGADVVIFSGSLNTANDEVFYATLSRAYDAAAEALVFNYLCSPMLAGMTYLAWRRPEEVLRFARGLKGGEVRTLEDYLEGDCTVAVVKPIL